MARHASVFSKLSRTFSRLGIEMKGDGVIYDVVIDSVPYCIEINEDKQTFEVFQYVEGLGGPLTKDQFDCALETVQTCFDGCYENYDGTWDEECAIFFSPTYMMEGVPCVTKAELMNIMSEFFDAWTFMCVNSCMVTDSTLSGIL